jgi:glycosyltransferase involved in cell wall biosynthesis
MKKVLAIAPYSYLPYFSGGQKFIAKFFEWLSKEVELTVISVSANDLTLAKTYQSIPMLKKNFSRYYDRSLVSTITALVEKEKFDTIIIEHPYYSWLAHRIRKRTGIQFILHTHNIEYQRFRSLGRWWWPLLKWYEKRSFKKADYIYFITPEDKNFAITNWNIHPGKCFDVPFGIDINSFPADRNESKKLISEKHGIAADEKIFSFNGLLDYKPNLDALKVILDEINPLLLKQNTFRYKIIISGKGLPEEMNMLKEWAGRNIIYTGFAEDIIPYLKATDIFLNPVQSGGGVKTKMVEAIGYGAIVVATETGATGIEKDVCGENLVIVPDHDREFFAAAIITHAGASAIVPGKYYDHYSWGNIIERLVQ